MHQNDALNRIFAGLRSRDELHDRQLAKSYKSHVALVVSELKGDGLSTFNNDLHRRISSSPTASMSTKKLGGIIAIEDLIEHEERGQ